MTGQDDTQDQQSLLNIYRRNLTHLLRQAASYGGEASAPVKLVNDLDVTRANIANLKAALRGKGVQVYDLLGEEDVLPTPPRLQPPALPSSPWWKRWNLDKWALAIAVLGLTVAIGQWVLPDPFRFGSAVLPTTEVGVAATLAPSASVVSATPTTALPPTAAPVVSSTPALPFAPTSAPVPSSTSIPPLAPTSAPVASGQFLVEVTIVSIKINTIPQLEVLDRLEPKGEGDVTVNINVAGQPRRWPVEPQAKHMRTGETAQIGEVFLVQASGTDTIALSIDALEMDPEQGNENDLLFRATSTISPAASEPQQRVLRDQFANADVTYTVVVRPQP